LLQRFLKPFLFLVCLVPLLRLIALGCADRLGANPVEFVTRSSGTWTLVLLCATLSVTPLRRLFAWNELLRCRRMLGLFTFFYGCLHLTTYVWFDQWFELSSIALDIYKRPFITIGFAAFVLMLPLALTSNHWSMKKLGRNWSKLHRLIYLVAIAALLHYFWHKGGKNNYDEPLIYAGVIALLFAVRIVYWWRSKSLRHAAAATSKQGR
jgi:methionine sulfoxide reductase heme-binding subunit